VYAGIELFMPGLSTSYRLVAVYYIDVSDVIMRSKLVKIKQSEISFIIVHHHNINEVLHIFTMVSLHAEMHGFINLHTIHSTGQ